MVYYVIVAEGIYGWTGKDWTCPVKRYKTRKLAENAIQRTKIPEFNKYKNKEVVERFSINVDEAKIEINVSK